MARRPSFQFYHGDHRANTKLRGASLHDRGAWWEVLCLLADSDEFGVLRWDLKRIADAIPCHVGTLQSLASQSILKGAGKGEHFAGHLHTDRYGVVHTLIAPCEGPIWFSSRMVLQEHLHTLAAVNGRRGGNPRLRPRHPIVKGAVKPPDNPHPKASSSSSPSEFPLSPPGGGEGGEKGDGGGEEIPVQRRKRRSKSERRQADLAAILQEQP